jgi:putative membrane protein
MKPNLNIFEPQRQSMQGILIIFGNSLQQIIRSAWPFLVITIYKFNSDKLYFYVAILSVLLVLGAVIAYLNYLKFNFYFDNVRKEFVVNKGILKKTKIAIPVEKIQQVNINQSLVQKIVNVYSLEIDTAGSATKEVKISAISHEIALQIKETLLDSERESISTSEVETIETNTKKPFVKLSLGLLLKIGLTTNYGRSIALLFGFVATTYNGLRDIIESVQIDTEEISLQMEQSFALFSGGIIIGIILFLILTLNMVRAIYKFYDFQIIKNKYSLLVISGLFTKKQTLLRPNKVQTIQYSQNFFQKKWKFFDMKMKQASSEETPNKKEESSFEVPGCSENQRDEILKMILKRIPSPYLSLKSNFRYLIKSFIFLILIPTGVYFSFAISIEEVMAKLYFYFIYLGLISIYTFFRFKNNTLFIDKDFVIKKSGAWDLEHEIIEVYKIQCIVLKQYFWHKKLNLGHINIFTAGGVLNFTFAPFDVLKKLTNEWVYKVENSKKSWM